MVFSIVLPSIATQKALKHPANDNFFQQCNLQTQNIEHKVSSPTPLQAENSFTRIYYIFFFFLFYIIQTEKKI